jgi:SRSO17 transposase
VAARFPRWESRRQARLYARGLVSGVERKKLLNVSAWDDAEVRTDLRALIARRFGGPEAVLIADETGFLKKGVKSASVQRQYSGTAGRVENCQLGVFLALAGNGGRALIDVELYLPES